MRESNPREQRILDSAAKLIAHYGYDKTTMDEIARAAGVSKGALYLHFKSKQALFEALILRDSETITERFMELIDDDPAGVTLFTMYRYALVVIDEAPLLKAILIRDRRVLGDWLQTMRDTPAYAQTMNLGVDFVHGAQEAGLLRRDLDAEVVAYLLRALRFGVLTMDEFTPNGQVPPSVAQMGDVLAEMVSNGLAPREGESDPVMARQALQRLIDMQREFTQGRRTPAN